MEKADKHRGNFAEGANFSVPAADKYYYWRQIMMIQKCFFLVGGGIPRFVTIFCDPQNATFQPGIHIILLFTSWQWIRSKKSVRKTSFGRLSDSWLSNSSSGFRGIELGSAKIHLSFDLLGWLWRKLKRINFVRRFGAKRSRIFVYRMPIDAKRLVQAGFAHNNLGIDSQKIVTSYPPLKKNTSISPAT